MAILPISFTILFVVCMLYGVGKVHGRHGPRVEVKGLCRLGSFLTSLCGFWGLNSGHQDWRKMLFP